MGKKKGKAKRYEAEVTAIRLTDELDELPEILDTAAEGLCSLIDAALESDSASDRTAARYLVSDLRSIVRAAAAHIEGREVAFSEERIEAEWRTQHAIEMLHTLKIPPPEGSTFTDKAEGARYLVSRRVKSLLEEICEYSSAEARA